MMSEALDEFSKRAVAEGKTYGQLQAEETAQRLRQERLYQKRLQELQEKRRRGRYK